MKAQGNSLEKVGEAIILLPAPATATRVCVRRPEDLVQDSPHIIGAARLEIESEIWATPALARSGSHHTLTLLGTAPGEVQRSEVALGPRSGRTRGWWWREALGHAHGAELHLGPTTATQVGGCNMTRITFSPRARQS